jgi:phytoene dehydrogenase-like protein
MPACDALVIGAGHNGLVAAATLARAGRRVIVIERAARVGGCVITSDIVTNFRCPTLAHRAALAPEVIGQLDLAAHGLKILRATVRACGLTGQGRALAIHADPAATARELSAFSSADAARFSGFADSVRRVSSVLRHLLSAPVPDPDDGSVRDVMMLLDAGRRFRGLGRVDAYRMLRWLPMPIADMTGEWFESEPLKALVAGDGILGGFLGPRSAGSAAVFLLRASTDTGCVAPGWTAVGGPGAITQALADAARKAGAEIRTGLAVDQIVVGPNGARGVVLSSGEELTARAVVSSIDPKRTLLGMVDAAYLPPTFSRHLQNIRMRGATAKVNFAVNRPPDFVDLRGRPEAEQQAILSGCVRLSPHLDAIERAFDAAKYGGFSDAPWIELTVPSIADTSLAPAGKHVVSAYVQFVPYALRGSEWDAERDRLGDCVGRAIGRLAPGFEPSVLAREVITPVELETRYGLTGGQIFQGELALDQILWARPVLGWARHRTPVERLFLCGSGTHPGLGVDGRSGLLAAREVLHALESEPLRRRGERAE